MQGLLVFESTIDWSGRRYTGKAGKREMKTLRISDEAHAKLTSVVGRLMAETGKMKTYSDAIEALLSKCVMLSPELLDEVGNFIKENSQLGYATEEEFIQDAIRSRLKSKEKHTTHDPKEGRTKP